MTFAKDEGPRRRYVARGAGEAQAGVPRAGHGHGGKFVADERRRRGSAGDVGKEGARNWA